MQKGKLPSKFQNFLARSFPNCPLPPMLMTNMAQDIPFHEIPLIRDCCNHQGSCTLVNPYLIIAAVISSSNFIQVSTRQLAVSSLSKGISRTLNSHNSTDIDRTQTRNLSHRKQALYRLSYLYC